MKRGQMQIQETLFVLVIFTVLLLIGLVVFYNYQQAHLEQKQEQLRKQVMETRILEILTSPLLSCSIQGQRSFCWDVTKFSSFDGSYGFMNISVTVVYPFEEQGLCDATLSLPCDSWNIYSHLPSHKLPLVREVPVALYYPHRDLYTIGLVRFEVYL